MSQLAITFDKFFALVPEAVKADLIDGVIYMEVSDSKLSNSIAGLLYFLFEGYTGLKRIEGFSFIHRFPCKVSDTGGLEPDVGYIRPDRMHLVHENHMDGGPDIAVEIVSRDSRSRDYGEKRKLYQTAGVTEYWIIDPLQKRVEFLRLREGRYELVPLEDNHIFRSAVIPGLWVNVDWLLAKPVPRAYQCLQEILNSLP